MIASEIAKLIDRHLGVSGRFADECAAEIADRVALGEVGNDLLNEAADALRPFAIGLPSSLDSQPDGVAGLTLVALSLGRVSLGDIRRVHRVLERLNNVQKDRS